MPTMDARRVDYDSEISELEQKGSELAEGLTRANERNAELEAELTEYRSGGMGTSLDPEWPDPKCPPHALMGIALICMQVAFVSQLNLYDHLHRISPPSYEEDYVIGVGYRAVAQFIFALWSFAIYKRKGIRSLLKHLATWVAGWAVVAGGLIHFHQNMPDINLRIADMILPTNWWAVPFQFTQDRDIELFFFTFWFLADLNSEFFYIRWVCSKLMSFADMARGRFA